MGLLRSLMSDAAGTSKPAPEAPIDHGRRNCRLLAPAPSHSPPADSGRPMCPRSARLGLRDAGNRDRCTRPPAVLCSPRRPRSRNRAVRPRPAYRRACARCRTWSPAQLGGVGRRSPVSESPGRFDGQTLRIRTRTGVRGHQPVNAFRECFRAIQRPCAVDHQQ